MFADSQLTTLNEAGRQLKWIIRTRLHKRELCQSYEKNIKVEKIRTNFVNISNIFAYSRVILSEN